MFSDADAVSAFVKFDGAGGLADIEDIIVWLADNSGGADAEHRMSQPPPPASPREVGSVDVERAGSSGGVKGREQSATQVDVANAGATDEDVRSSGQPSQRLSMKDQNELMAKIEADPDNMDLLMQLQEVHRSLSMVSTHVDILECRFAAIAILDVSGQHQHDLHHSLLTACRLPNIAGA